ncbi:MAG: epoxyqueuosine reductase QueH [Bacillota bacterium]
MDKFLLHVCCGPCALGAVPAFRAEGLKPVGYYFNPNIHPWREYAQRWDALRAASKSLSLPLMPPGRYDYREYLKQALLTESRCESCYRIRLLESARKAAEQDLSSFSTTLLISPYQNREILIAAGRDAAAQYGLKFLEPDLRPFFHEGRLAAKNNGIYLQGYCGCIFSEHERYGKNGLEQSR